MPYRGAVIDLDGTVYRGEEPIPGAADGVRALRDAGLDVLFVSNNPTKRPESFARTLSAMGVPAEAEDVVTSGTVTVAYLVEEHPGESLFVVGESGLREQLREAGFDLVTEPRSASVVVASYDRGFDYEKLTDALHALEPGPDGPDGANDGAGEEGTTAEPVTFLGTDPDRVIPAAGGEVVPGSGAIVGAVAATADREPDRILGKPDPFTVERVLDRLGVPAGECLLVGDRLDTDIAMGERAGMTTVLVRTGVTGEAALRSAPHSPDHVVESLADVETVLDANGSHGL